MGQAGRIGNCRVGRGLSVCKEKALNMAKMLLAPKIAEPGIPGFLLWAQRDDPALYASLVRAFPEVAAFDAATQGPAALGGFMDIFASIGSSLASKAGSISQFVLKNALPIATAVVPVYVAKKQADAAKTQIKIAQANGSPAQTAMTTDANGYTYAVPVQRSIGGSIAGVPVWVLLAGGAAVVAVLLLRRR
jgi:hypothetical protein